MRAMMTRIAGALCALLLAAAPAVAADFPALSESQRIEQLQRTLRLGAHVVVDEEDHAPLPGHACHLLDDLVHRPPTLGSAMEGAHGAEVAAETAASRSLDQADG